MPLAKLEEDFRGVDAVGDVEMAPDVNIPSAQQLVPANGLVVVYPDLDLGLTRVNHESTLLVPGTLGTRRLGTMRSLVLLVSTLQDHIRFETISSRVVVFRLNDSDPYNSGLVEVTVRISISARDTLTRSMNTFSPTPRVSAPIGWEA